MANCDRESDDRQGLAQSTRCNGAEFGIGGGPSASTLSCGGGGGDHLNRGCIIGANIGPPGKPIGPAANAGCIVPGGIPIIPANT